MKQWLINGLTLLSQTGNWLFFNGHPDQTISARCYVQRREAGWGWGYRTVNRIFKALFNQHDHCLGAFLEDRQRAIWVLNVSDLN